MITDTQFVIEWFFVLELYRVVDKVIDVFIPHSELLHQYQQQQQNSSFLPYARNIHKC